MELVFWSALFCSPVFQPKKKNMSAYQVFCKEYRVTIVADHPGIGKGISHLRSHFPRAPRKQCTSFRQEAASPLVLKGAKSHIFPADLQVTLDFVLSSPQP